MDAVKRLGRRLRLLTVASLLLVPLAACGGSSESSEDGLGTLRVVSVVPNSLLFIGVQAADRLGTWDDTTLKVEHIQGKSENAGQIMASGEADIGLTEGNRALANIAEGLDASLTASAYTPWGQLLIVGDENDADSVEDLKGATFGVSGEGSAGHYSAHQIAKSLGWASDDYKISSLGDVNALTAALDSGAIDSFAWSSTTAYDLEEKGVGRIIADVDDYVGPVVFEAFSIMNDVAEERPEAVKAFFEGYFEAIKRIQDDPQLAIDILVEDWDVNPEAAKRSVEREVPKLSTDGAITDKELRGTANAAKFATGKTVDDPENLYKYWKEFG